LTKDSSIDEKVAIDEVRFFSAFVLTGSKHKGLKGGTKNTEKTCQDIVDIKPCSLRSTFSTFLLFTSGERSYESQNGHTWRTRRDDGKKGEAKQASPF
jgi:hypothetical protein